MLVDELLWFYEINPAAYPIVQDKWSALIAEVFVRSFIYFPIVFGVLPLVYLYVKRKKYRKDRKGLIIRTIIYPIAGATFGFFILYLILGALASITAYELYGGTI